jgi:hypothetical protein
MDLGVMGDFVAALFVVVFIFGAPVWVTLLSLLLDKGAKDRDV